MRWLALALLAGCSAQPLDPIEQARLQAIRELRTRCMHDFSNDPAVRMAAYDACHQWAKRSVR